MPQPEHPTIAVDLSLPEIAYLRLAVALGQGPKEPRDEVNYRPTLSALLAQAAKRAREGERALPVVRSWNLRESEYYGGYVRLIDRRDPTNGQWSADLAWAPYEGGAVELYLAEEELSALRDALIELLDGRR